SVRRNLKVKKYYSQLLDNALHHSAMKQLKNSEKRGRPDITHICLLNALGSPLNKNGNLKIYIHTIQNKIFKINSEIRIARNYNRFKGLVVNLLLDRQIVDKNIELISQVDGNLKNLIKTFENSEVLLFSKTGNLIKNYQNIFPTNLSKNYIAIIGGFQKGRFSNEILLLSKKLVSISEYPLDAWIVVNKIINYYEIIHKII
ncbi:MAG: 16S rRNA methyltransferase, partial [Promethearchaeota archaeon]